MGFKYFKSLYFFRKNIFSLLIHGAINAVTYFFLRGFQTISCYWICEADPLTAKRTFYYVFFFFLPDLRSRSFNRQTNGYLITSKINYCCTVILLFSQ